MNTYCKIMIDAEIMERKLSSKGCHMFSSFLFYGEHAIQIGIIERREGLVLLPARMWDAAITFMDSLTQCQKCREYIGPYPEFKFDD